MSSPIRFYLFPPDLLFCLSSFVKLLFQAYKLLFYLMEACHTKPQQHISTAKILHFCSSHQNPSTLHKRFLKCAVLHFFALWERLGSHYVVLDMPMEYKNTITHKKCLCSLSPWKIYKSKIKKIRLLTLVDAMCSIFKETKNLEKSF